MSARDRAEGILAFSLTVFASAFLLFQVQPLIGKYILPWFGGTPAVWTTCMLFFQVLLLVGYAYAHLSIRRLRPRAQAAVHILCLGAALAVLPITPASSWKPETAEDPTARILALLAFSVGLPCFVLSATGPLLQRWFAELNPGLSPYRLYALSNLGSLLALVGYPFLVEPAFSRKSQAGGWSIGFAVFALVAGYCAVRRWRHPSSAVAWEEERGEAAAAAPRPETRILWLSLSACASVLLLAVTNQLCLDVAVIPFLWVLPLSLYLLSFILCFDRTAWYPRPIFAVALPVCLAGLCTVLFLGSEKDAPILLQIAMYAVALFVCCMVCHGELVRLKPHPRHLTSFYLMVATGGAAGGVFVALIAPLVFHGYFELHLGLAGCALLALVVFFRDKNWVLYRGRPLWAWGLLSAAFAGLAIALYLHAKDFTEDALTISRDFYGVLAVTEYDEDEPRMHHFVLSHGTTLHGLQFDAPDKRRWPTAYYGEESGVGLALRYFPRSSGLRVGVVGLGVGTVAAYGKHGDYYRMYEINPEVARLATTRFTYLKDSPATIEVVLGDARISMEREPAQGFDVLVLDAFSSDAIPVHLLTREALELYRRHLKPDGVIAVHASNWHLELEPVIAKLGDHYELESILVQDEGDAEEEEEEEGEGEGEGKKVAASAGKDRAKGLYSSTWVLLTVNEEFLDLEPILEAGGEVERWDRIRLWTDDDVNLFQIVK